MPTTIKAERAKDFKDLFEARKQAGSFPFSPVLLAHLYVKLDFQPKYENATTADDARAFLRSVARASHAAQMLADRRGGTLMEVQGSLLHIGIPVGNDDFEPLLSFAGELHQIYNGVFDDRASRVQSWCMTMDVGKTLVVSQRGVHGDDSWVSLGTAANRPAKYLYSQLERNKEDRALKDFHIGCWHPTRREWVIEDLAKIRVRLDDSVGMVREARQFSPQVLYKEARSGLKETVARAVPVDFGDPVADKPEIYFGWLMRADLDGFTKRVEQCMNDDAKLQALATEFYQVMQCAADFTARHKESMVQLPWAGDNFTAAAVFATRDSYDDAAPKRLVELALDFEKEMGDRAGGCGFGGWAYGVAGGTVHGNAGGNVYLGAVILAGRRFLVGAGEGVGRSAQAFGDINPKASELVLYKVDWDRLHDSYKRAFETAVTVRAQPSTLFKKASALGLNRVRASAAAAPAQTRVSVAPGQYQTFSSKPHHP
ncbi:MAG TPA: hypothetical protein VD971_02160 [Phycisphaerales bacterium]|nr:hypothetical protein [Phycisphaerales bacterium]